jgi:DNA-binding NtrC family response regulator
MPLSLQFELLQVLQGKCFHRPGTSALTEIDVRIIATSNRSIERAISENRLHEDLYRILSNYTIYIPPLRERKEELSFLSRHFMQRLAKQYGLTPREFSAATLAAWQAYSWPGNLRELRESVKRYLMVGDEQQAFEKNSAKSEGTAPEAVQPRPNGSNHFPALHSQSTTEVPDAKTLRSLIKRVKSDAERNAIAAALQRTGWNRKAAARLLKVSYRTLLYKIVEYRMTPSNSALFSSGNGRRREDAAIREAARKESTDSENQHPRSPHQESL